MKKAIHTYFQLMLLPLSIFTIFPSTFSQVQLTGNLTNYIDNFIGSLPSTYGGNEYQPPSTSDLNIWGNAVTNILQGNYSSAHSTADGIGYRVVEYTDNSVNPNKKYYILEKKSSSANYWGMFIYNPIAARTKLFIQSPHPKYDLNTGKQGFYIFKNQSCRAFFVSGTHRCNNSTSTTCSGTSTVCTEQNDPYKISDQAHVVNGTLQRATEILNSTITNLVVIQVHGFSQDSGDPDLIISNGTRYTPNPDHIVSLKDNLLSIDNTLTFKIAHLDQTWTKLIATVNTQGRLLNGSGDPCSQSATATSGRFIHVEQSLALRNTDAARKKLSDAIGLTFTPDGLALTSLNGGEVLTSGNNYNITWSTSGLVSTIKLDYSTNNGASWSTITPSTTNTGSYSWAVPNIGTWRAKIRISDAEYSTIGDTSNSNFKITHAVYPTTGTTLFVDPAAAFSPRLLNGVYDFHRGMDFPGTYNIPIRPAQAGVIVRKEDSTVTAGTGLQRFGNWILVRIDSANGQPRHNAYLHLNGFHRFNVGDTVSTIDTIGYMGKSGYEINTIHLHFELYKNLNGTAIDKDKAKNPIEILPYTNSNSYVVNFITNGDSSAVEVSTPDTELDFDGLTIYGSSASRTIGFNSRVGIDPLNNDNPYYNDVSIVPDQFIQDSSTQRIRFWTKNSVIGTIDSVLLNDAKGYSVVISQSSFGNRYAVTSGNWNAPIWASTPSGAAGSASIPINFNNVVINSNITVTINVSNAECNSISFGSTTSKLAFASNSVLSVHGDFSLASMTHNAFSSWASGAKFRFTGNQPIQTIRNLYKEASTFSSSFMELIIDKPIGKVTVEDSVRFNIGTSMEILSGTFELAYRADIEGRNLTGSATAPTILIQAGGKFEMVGSLSHIRSGTSTSMNPIGKMTVFGISILRSTSSNGLSLGGIDVKSGGLLYFDSFSNSWPNVIKTSVVNIESEGRVQINTNVAFWHSSSSVSLNPGGFYILNSNPPSIDNSFPSSFTNNGTVEYAFNGNQTIKTLSYVNLIVSGSGVKNISNDVTISNNLEIKGGNLITGVYNFILSPSATMSENNGSLIIGNVNTTRNIVQGVNNNLGGMGIEINALGNSPGETYVLRVTGTAITAGGNGSIKRYYFVSPTNNNSLNANLIFHYDESELNGIPESNIKLFKSPAISGNWSFMDGTINSDNNTITLNNIDQFSYWTAGDVNAPISAKNLNLTLLIEGLFRDSTMISDTVTVELHNTYPSYALVDQTQTVLNSSGNGSAVFSSAVDATSYYIVIKHRNAIETWSSTELSFNSGLLSYDFTNSPNKAFGSNMVKMGDKWCIYSGDVNQDGIINSLDMNEINQAAFDFIQTYASADFNGDLFVDINDLIICDNNAYKEIATISPLTLSAKKETLKNQEDHDEFK